MTQKICPFLWFDDNAEEAVIFYTGIFRNSRIFGISRYPDEGPGIPGKAMTVEFELEGLRYIALNGGPVFKFNEAGKVMNAMLAMKKIDIAGLIGAE